jgi:hypothetical protein
VHDLDLDRGLDLGLDLGLAQAADASARLSPRQRAVALTALYLACLAVLVLAGIWAAPASAAGAAATAPNGTVTTTAGTSSLQVR